MSVEYDFWKKPVLKGKEDKGEMVPRVVPKGTKRLEDMSHQIHQGSTLQVAEVEAVLNSLIKEVVRNLENGYSVELGNLGYFSLKLTSRTVTDKKKIHGQSISVRTINYQPSSWMKNQFKSTHFERSTKGFVSSAAIPEERRKKMLDNYLENHPFIKRMEYSQLVGRLKTSALADLNKWVEEGFLKKEGSGSHVVFMKKTQ